MGRHNFVFVVHPEHVRHVLVTGRKGFDKGQAWESSRQLLLGDGLIASTGELWKRQRRNFFTPRSVDDACNRVHHPTVDVRHEHQRGTAPGLKCNI
jgi:cytochrome P450